MALITEAGRSGFLYIKKENWFV